MKLHYSLGSPYVRKVMVTAIEAGVADKIDKVSATLAGLTGNEEKHAADNPLGKIPALVTDDGLSLFDSPVICEYVDSLNRGTKLFPPAGPARWKALRHQALADGMMDAAVLRRYETLRPQGAQSQDWDGKNKRVVARSLDQLEAEAAAGQLEGPLDIGKIAVGCILGYLDFRFAAERWRQGRPKLAAWYEKLAQRKSFLDTVPKDVA